MLIKKVWAFQKILYTFPQFSRGKRCERQVCINQNFQNHACKSIASTSCEYTDHTILDQSLPHCCLLVMEMCKSAEKKYKFNNLIVRIALKFYKNLINIIMLVVYDSNPTDNSQFEYDRLHVYKYKYKTELKLYMYSFICLSFLKEDFSTKCTNSIT